MNRVVHFEIHAADPKRAAEFYHAVFGWDVREWVVPGVEIPDENRYWLVTTGPTAEPGIDGGILLRRGSAPADGQPVNAFVCTIAVSSVDDLLAKAVAAGASVAVSKMPIKGVGWVAYIKDTEGNIVGLLQDDSSAG